MTANGSIQELGATPQSVSDCKAVIFNIQGFRNGLNTRNFMVKS